MNPPPKGYPLKIAATAPRPSTRRSRPTLALAAGGLVALLLVAVLLSGCTLQAAVDTKVEPDGSGTVGIALTADKAVQDSLSDTTDSLGGKLGGILGILGDLSGVTKDIPKSADDLFNLIIGAIPGGWDIERGTDASGARWYRLTHDFADSQEFEEILSGKFLSAIMATEEVSLTTDKGLFSTKTVYSVTGRAGSVASGAERVTDLAGRLIGDVLVVENRLTLPGSLKDNNADVVQGNSLVWNLDGSETREMRAESVTYHWRAIIAAIFAAIVVIALIIVLLVPFLRRRRRATQLAQAAAVQPEQPATVVPPAAPSGPAEEGAAPPAVKTEPPTAAASGVATSGASETAQSEPSAQYYTLAAAPEPEDSPERRGGTDPS
jgi:hypothetical protein